MTPEQWERISEIFDRALTLEGREREVYLSEVCAEDPGFREEVESLLVSHRQADSKFLLAPEGVLDEPAENGQPAEAGRRIGAYLVEGEIGHGGMGEVFAASRADGQYEKKVALKLVRSGYETTFILERFRNERQILASLDHPNIARLLEGGTSDDGAPYLVMELVEGDPIDSYCEAHKLSVTERLLLFRQVCSAVQYAHQQLVIHRDIKPDNILVTKEGVPKLLDFGIAKILDPSGSTEATMLRPMTPEYASPEQVRGDAISTHTDVYSLGVVLYKLLTGRSPYRVNTPTPARLAEAITHDEPERPSTAIHRKEETGAGAHGDSSGITPKAVIRTMEATLARLQKRLRGDLDFILLKALRKEAAQRYSSVEQMSEDIRRHLEGIPIAARKGTWSYRSGKFVRRHRVSVLAALLVMGTLVTAIVVTRREELIAEARFNDVRKLANSLMFEVHDSIQQVPGTTAARKLIIDRAQEYLDVLAKDSKSDSSLQQELAASYSKLASVQGHSQGANLGDSAGAVKNYRKAVELLTNCLARDSRNRNIALQLSRAYQDLALAQDSTGDQAEARNSTQKALNILDSLAKSQPEDPRLRYEIATALEQTGTLIAVGNDSSQAGEYYKQALAMLVPLGQANPERKDVQMEISFVHKHMGSLLGIQHQLPAALEHYRAALAIDEAQLRADPSNAQVRYNITYTYSDTGWILSQQREFDAALDYYSKAWQIRSELAAADPNEVRAREGMSNTDDYIGWIYTQKLDFGRALHWYQDALTIRESLAQRDPANDRVRLKLAVSQARIAETYINMASQAHLSPGDHLRYCREAQNWILKALPVFKQQEAQGKLAGTNVGKPAALQKLYEGCNRTSAPPS